MISVGIFLKLHDRVLSSAKRVNLKKLPQWGKSTINKRALGLFPAGFFPAVFSPLGLSPAGFFPAGMDFCNFCNFEKFQEKKIPKKKILLCFFEAALFRS